MSSMWSEDEKVIAILLADLHLSLKAPLWRSAESDWLETQKRVLLEISDLQLEYNCPIFCAGDILNQWNCSPELINYTINYLFDMYAIPGQHDLPLHQYEDIHRSAYLTLVKAGKIQNILPGCCVVKNDMVIQGFPFGYKITPCLREDKLKLHIAAVHDYVWIPGCSYPEAPKEKQIKSTKLRNGKLMGYDVIIFGDNHKGFLTKVGKTTIFNCGTLMRRKSDEIDYKPQVGLLLESGKVIPHYLDISKDKYLETIEEEEVNPELDMKSFMEELEKLDETAFDFAERMKQFLQRTKKISDQAKEIILNAMEKGGKKNEKYT